MSAALRGNPSQSYGANVTCHMGSDSVTCQCPTYCLTDKLVACCACTSINQQRVSKVVWRSLNSILSSICCRFVVAAQQNSMSRCTCTACCATRLVVQQVRNKSNEWSLCVYCCCCVAVWWNRCSLGVALTTAWRHHGGNCGLNTAPQGDAQEAHCRQSTTG